MFKVFAVTMLAAVSTSSFTLVASASNNAIANKNVFISQVAGEKTIFSAEIKETQSQVPTYGAPPPSRLPSPSPSPSPSPTK